MRLLVKSPLYLADVEEMWRYIAADKVSAADRLFHTVENKLSSLAEQPMLGTVCDFAPNLRRFAIGNYVLFYRVTDRTLEAVRLLHGARNIEALLGGEAHK